MQGMGIVDFVAGTIKCLAQKMLILCKMLSPEIVDFVAETIKLWAQKMLILWLEQ